MDPLMLAVASLFNVRVIFGGWYPPKGFVVHFDLIRRSAVVDALETWDHPPPV